MLKTTAAPAKQQKAITVQANGDTGPVIDTVQELAVM